MVIKKNLCNLPVDSSDSKGIHHIFLQLNLIEHEKWRTQIVIKVRIEGELKVSINIDAVVLINAHRAPSILIRFLYRKKKKLIN